MLSPGTIARVSIYLRPDAHAIDVANVVCHLPFVSAGALHTRVIVPVADLRAANALFASGDDSTAVTDDEQW
jgi:hypothetical protein